VSELGDLYQEVIIEHSKSPRNFAVLDGATATVEAYNPLCGDQITLYLKLADGRIEDISFQGQGCAISKASTSLMTQALKGEDEVTARALFAEVHTMLTEGPEAVAEPEHLGKLAVLSGVSEYPARVKCASLGWHALKSALDEGAKPVSTE
jgi:nitrogen fixation protein NifU and related proteins